MRAPHLLVALSISVASSTAAASPSLLLFEAAVPLMDAGRFAEACPLLQISLWLQPALGTQLNLADCRAGMGQLVEARQLYQDIVDRAAEDPTQQRVGIARTAIAQLDLQMPRATIVIRPERAAEITVDDVAVAAGAVLAFDPGPHRAVAVTDDRQRLTTTWEAKVGEAREIVLTPAAAPVPPVAPVVALHRAAPARHRARTFALVSLGSTVALGLLAVGTKAASGCKTDDAQFLCPPGTSSAWFHTARVFTVGATVGLVATVGFATAALIERRRGTKRHLVPVASPEHVGVALGGRW